MRPTIRFLEKVTFILLSILLIMILFVVVAARVRRDRATAQLGGRANNANP